MPHRLYPLKVSYICHEKIWGGTKLSEMIKIPRDKLIGEVSLVTDSKQGSTILNGFLKGKSLLEVTQEFGKKLVGSLSEFSDRFPMHLKLIHAKKQLSIQVHPDDEYAVRHENALSGKAEAWLILDAEKEARVNIGFKDEISREKVEKVAEQGSLPEYLKSYTVSRGDTFYLPPGTIHSLGAGILLAEIQQNSQLTYRLFDYNRIDQKTGVKRPLNIKKALDVLNYSSLNSANTINKTVSQGSNKITTLVTCPSFCGQSLVLNEPYPSSLFTLSAVIYTVLEGCGSFCLRDLSSEQHLEVSKGDTIIIPAQLENCELIPVQTMKVLKFFLPV